MLFIDKKLTSEAELDGDILSSMERSLNYPRAALVKSILTNKYGDAPFKTLL